MCMHMSACTCSNICSTWESWRTLVFLRCVYESGGMKGTEQYFSNLSWNYFLVKRQGVMWPRLSSCFYFPWLLYVLQSLVYAVAQDRTQGTHTHARQMLSVYPPTHPSIHLPIFELYPWHYVCMYVCCICFFKSLRFQLFSWFKSIYKKYACKLK